MRKTPFWRRHLRMLGSDPAADVDDELAFHLEMRVEELMRRGVSQEEARERTAREFGDVGRVRGELREIGRKRQRREKRGHRWGSLGQDARFALRTVRRSPGFAAVVVATLALGIGGTTAVFSVVKAVLLAPLPYEEPGELVRIYQHDDGDREPLKGFVSGPHFKAVRDQAGSFESVAALYTYAETGLDLAEGGRAQRLRTLRVSRDYFRTLRAGTLTGRGFGEEDEAGLPNVVLSHELWRTRFGADPRVLGSTVRLSAEPYTVVGIAPAGLEDPVVGPVDAWLPVDLASSSANEEENHFLSTIGRLRGGVEPGQARMELASINRALAERFPDVAGDSLVLFPLKQDLVGASRGTLHLLLVAVGLVLLVACVNVANLFLVRSTGRIREFAIRSALGSGGGRIARQLLVESVALAVPGGALGLALAVLGVRALRALGGDAIPRLDEVSFDPVVLGFAAAVTLATGLAFGVAPALRFGRVQPASALREQSRSATGSRAQGRVRNGLAAAQIALALTLLAGAGVLVVSYGKLRGMDLGFRDEGVLTFEVALPAARYDAARRAAFQEELAARMEAIPGVTAAGGISRLPATGSYQVGRGHPERPARRRREGFARGRAAAGGERARGAGAGAAAARGTLAGRARRARRPHGRAGERGARA
jgi:predicted permease